MRLLIATLIVLVLLVIASPVGLTRSVGLGVPAGISGPGAKFLAVLDVVLACATIVAAQPFRKGIDLRSCAIALLMASAVGISLFALGVI